MSVASVWGFALVGIEAVPVRVEAHARNGLPGVTIVGLPGAAVREARERVRSGAASSGLPLPTRRITINLSPGDVPKEGSGFDLPVALATLAACGYLPAGGRARHRRGGGGVSGRRWCGPAGGWCRWRKRRATSGCACLLTPVEGLPAASEVATVPVAGVRSLAEAVRWCRTAVRRERVLERGRRWLRSRDRGAAAVDGESARFRPGARPAPGQAGAWRSSPRADITC